MSLIYQLTLSEDVMERLDDLATLQGVSKADLVRQAVDDFLSDRPPVEGESSRAQLRRNLRKITRDLTER